MRRAIFPLAIVLLAICSVALAAKAWSYRSIARDTEALLATERLRIPPEFASSIVRRDADLPLAGKIDERAAVAEIREYVYRNFDPDADQMTGGIASDYYAALGSDRNGMLCGGASLAYSWALMSVGIPARYVQLAGKDFIAGKNLYQTHVTVEVLVDGEWQISDPTYNATIVCANEPNIHLSVDGVMTCLAKGQTIRFQHGKTLIASREIPIEKYAGYFSAFVRRPVEVGNTVEPQHSHPTDDWLEAALTQYAED